MSNGLGQLMLQFSCKAMVKLQNMLKISLQIYESIFTFHSVGVKRLKKGMVDGWWLVVDRSCLIVDGW